MLESMMGSVPHPTSLAELAPLPPQGQHGVPVKKEHTEYFTVDTLSGEAVEVVGEKVESRSVKIGDKKVYTQEGKAMGVVGERVESKIPQIQLL